MKEEKKKPNPPDIYRLNYSASNSKEKAQKHFWQSSSCAVLGRTHSHSPRSVRRQRWRPVLGPAVPQARSDCTQLLLRDLATAFHPQTVTLHIRDSQSKTSNAAAAPAPGRGCSPEEQWEHREEPRKDSRRPDISSLSSPARTRAGLQPTPQASGEAGWIQPQTRRTTPRLPTALLPLEPPGHKQELGSYT